MLSPIHACLIRGSAAFERSAFSSRLLRVRVRPKAREEIVACE